MILIDENTIVIGFYNFDPWSANYNNECISIIRSEAVSRNLSKYIEKEFLLENSWQLNQNHNLTGKPELKNALALLHAASFRKNSYS